jgi:hypothetical protein
MKLITTNLIKSLLFLLVITFTSCSKEEFTSLPTGENTMYYYINGELYVPKAQGGFLDSTPAIYLSDCYDSETFMLKTKNLGIQFSDGIQQSSSSPLQAFQNNQDYCEQINSYAFYVKKVKVGLYEDGSPAYDYIKNYTENNAGEINITWLSEDHRHFKGTFEFTVFDTTKGKDLSITNGHFDINLDTLNQ